jgi:hypothetical protein
LKNLTGFEVEKKKQPDDWSAGILACLVAKQSKKFRCFSRLKVIKDLYSHYATLRFASFCYTLVARKMRALQSFSCLFPFNFKAIQDFTNYKFRW